MNAKGRFAGVLAMVVALPVVSAQTPTALIYEGGSIPGTGTVWTVGLNLSRNNAGGFAVRGSAASGAFIFGSVDAQTPGAVLKTVASNVTLDSSPAIDDAGDLLYVVSSSGVNGGWKIKRNNVTVIKEGDGVPSMPGMKYYPYNGAVHGSSSGNAVLMVPYGVANQPSPRDVGFFVGSNETFVFGNGSSFPNLPGPILLTTQDNIFDTFLNYSANGSHWMAIVNVLWHGCFVLRDGAVLMTDTGVLGGWNTPISAANGGFPGEFWSGFTKPLISEKGEYAMMARSFLPPSGGGSVVVRDGDVIYRHGDIVDGARLELTSPVDTAGGLDMNESGDIAYIWQDVTVGTDQVAGLFLNDRLLAKEGDLVDLDGDGVLNPEAKIERFWGEVVVTPEGRVLAITRISVSGTNRFALLAIDDPCGRVRRFGVGCAGQGGFVPKLRVDGCMLPGNAVEIGVDRALGGMTALVFVGAGRAKSTVGQSGCFLSLAGPLFPTAFLIPLTGVGFGNGSGSAFVGIPPAIGGVEFTIQAWVPDPTVQLGVVSTQGLEVAIP